MTGKSIFKKWVMGNAKEPGVLRPCPPAAETGQGEGLNVGHEGGGEVSRMVPGVWPECLMEVGGERDTDRQLL